MTCYLELVQAAQRRRHFQEQSWKHICYEAGTVMFLPHGTECPDCGKHEPLKLTPEEF
jgi:rRNA maturation endonuclease Nob1